MTTFATIGTGFMKFCCNLKNIYFDCLFIHLYKNSKSIGMFCQVVRSGKFVLCIPDISQYLSRNGSIINIFITFLLILLIWRLGNHVYYVWWVHGSMASNKVVRIKATLSSFQRLMCRTTIDEGGMLHFFNRSRFVFANVKKSRKI